MSSSDNSIYLIKDYPIQAIKDERTCVSGKDIQLANTSGTDDLIGGSSSSVQAISDYVQTLKSTNKKLLCVYVYEDEMNDEFDFHIDLHKVSVEFLCNALANAYLHVSFKLKHPSNDADRTTLEKRLELSDVLEHLTRPRLRGNDVLWQRFRLFSADDSIERNVLCDVILGWTEPASPKVTPIKIGVGSFMENMYRREASKDLRLVAGNGTEVKCHRVIFEAHGDVLSAMLSPENGMKESTTGVVDMRDNSEEGLSLLVRYFYGMELTEDDLSSVDVTVELFRTADKYLLAILQQSLGQFLLGKGKDWFSPGALIELYFHVRNLERWKDLEVHALNIMLELSDGVRMCERFKELNTADALALVWKLLDVEKLSKIPVPPTPKRKRKFKR